MGFGESLACEMAEHRLAQLELYHRPAMDKRNARRTPYKWLSSAAKTVPRPNLSTASSGKFCPSVQKKQLLIDQS